MWEESRAGAIPCGRNPVREQSHAGGIPCGSNPVREQSRAGAIPCGSKPVGSNPVWEESRAGGVPWEGFRGRDPVREESRWNRFNGYVTLQAEEINFSNLNQVIYKSFLKF